MEGHGHSSPSSPSPFFLSSPASPSLPPTTTSPQTIHNGKWALCRRIGAGAFGDVYIAETLIQTDPLIPKWVAIKRERKSLPQPQLSREYTNYQYLSDRRDRIPKNTLARIYWFGEDDEFRYLVMDLLGPTLKDLSTKLSTSDTLPLRTVIYAIIHAIQTLRIVHDNGLVFRDVKPEQFCIGSYTDWPGIFSEAIIKDSRFPYTTDIYTLLKRGEPSVLECMNPFPDVRVIDFGLATPIADNPSSSSVLNKESQDLYIPASSTSTSSSSPTLPLEPAPQPPPHSRNRRRRKQPAFKSQPKTGTARYASLSVHRGHRHYRKDDLESLAYVAIELARGKFSLPWYDVTALTAIQGWSLVCEKKANVLLVDLTEGLPVEFMWFLEYARELHPNSNPDYGLCLNWFVDVWRELERRESMGESVDGPRVWESWNMKSRPPVAPVWLSKRSEEYNRWDREDSRVEGRVGDVNALLNIQPGVTKPIAWTLDTGVPRVSGSISQTETKQVEEPSLSSPFFQKLKLSSPSPPTTEMNQENSFSTFFKQIPSSVFMKPQCPSSSTGPRSDEQNWRTRRQEPDSARKHHRSK